MRGDRVQKSGTANRRSTTKSSFNFFTKPAVQSRGRRSITRSWFNYEVVVQFRFRIFSGLHICHFRSAVFLTIVSGLQIQFRLVHVASSCSISRSSFNFCT